MYGLGQDDVSLRIILSVEALEPRLSGIGRYSWELAQRLPLLDGVDSVRFYRNGEWIADPATLLVDQGSGKRRNIVQRWLRKHSKWARNLRDASIMRSNLFHGPN